MKKSLWMIYQDYLETNPIWHQDYDTFRRNYLHVHKNRVFTKDEHEVVYEQGETFCKNYRGN